MSLKFYQPIPHGADRLHTVPPPRLRHPCPTRLFIETQNILDGWGFGMVQVILDVERGGFGLILLTETKIYTTAYCQKQLGCKMT